MRNKNINGIFLYGFKNSKSGLLPEKWAMISLEKDCILMSGLRPKGGASDEGIPSLGGEHITLDGRINFSDVNAKYIPEKFFKIMTKGKTEENDILINKDGANTGKVAMLKKKFYKDIAINEHLFILRSKKLFVQQYLFYWLFSRFGQKQITDRITGSAQPGLSSTFIKNFLVPRPPLPEQRKIAEILETIDNA
ncbi:MAG TPA: restriction endonuclease subunit S, partial [Defluviitoga tunisiensis]|nr:restriction endonuclease subunit S [Defluviitoga tunisiensis]